jgi:type I restriction enzyme S subunit
LRPVYKRSLPTGWAESPLRAVTARRRGYSWAKDQETDAGEPGAVPVVRIPNIQDRLDRRRLLYLRRVKPEELEGFSVRRNWILFVASNGNPDRIGDSVLIEEDEPMVFASFLQGMTSIDPKRVAPGFLARWLRLDTVHQTFSKTSQQTTGLANFSWGAVKNLPVRYPEDLGEQKAILRVLDEMDAVVDDDRELEAAKRLKQGLLEDFFTRGLPGRHEALYQSKWLTCPADWTRRPLLRLAQMESGFTMGRDLRGAETVALPYVTVVNVQAGRFDLSSVSTTLLKESEAEDGLLRVGDVLITEGGDRDKLGRGAIWEGAITPCTYQNHIFRIRLDESQYRSKLFHYLIQARRTKRYFGSLAKQTSNLCSINSRDVAQLQVGVPEHDEQDEMVRRLEAVDDLIAAVEAKLTGAIRLRRALLEALVSGERRIEGLVGA